MDDVELAKQTVQRLESNLAAANRRAAEMQRERRRIAFSAHGGDDARARKELEKLNTLSTTISFEIENIPSAINEGKQRLAEAEDATRWEAARANAGRVKEIAARVETRGPAISAALSTLCSEFGQLESDLLAMRELGAQIVPQRLVALSFADVVSHTLRSVGL